MNIKNIFETTTELTYVKNTVFSHSTRDLPLGLPKLCILVNLFFSLDAVTSYAIVTFIW